MNVSGLMHGGNFREAASVSSKPRPKGGVKETSLRKPTRRERGAGLHVETSNGNVAPTGGVADAEDRTTEGEHVTRVKKHRVDSG